MSNLITVVAHGIARLVWRAEPPPAHRASFVGVATLTTSRPDFRGPYTRPLSADLLIDERCRVTVASVDLGPVKVGSVMCTISQLPKTGVGTYGGDALHLTIGLHVGIGVLRAHRTRRSCSSCPPSPPARESPPKGGSAWPVQRPSRTAISAADWRQSSWTP